MAYECVYTQKKYVEWFGVGGPDGVYALHDLMVQNFWVKAPENMFINYCLFLRKINVMSEHTKTD